MRMAVATLTADAAPSSWLEQAGTLLVFGVAAGVLFSIAAAQIFLAAAIACWVALLIIRRESIEVPRFFWPLAAYAAITLVSAAASTDPVRSFIDSKQLVLFLIVPLVYRFVPGRRGASMVTVPGHRSARSARRTASSSTASSTTTSSACVRAARSGTT